HAAIVESVLPRRRSLCCQPAIVDLLSAEFPLLRVRIADGLDAVPDAALIPLRHVHDTPCPIDWWNARRFHLCGHCLFTLRIHDRLARPADGRRRSLVAV